MPVAPVGGKELSHSTSKHTPQKLHGMHAFLPVRGGVTLPPLKGEEGFVFKFRQQDPWEEVVLQRLRSSCSRHCWCLDQISFTRLVHLSIGLAQCWLSSAPSCLFLRGSALGQQDPLYPEYLGGYIPPRGCGEA